MGRWLAIASVLVCVALGVLVWTHVIDRERGIADRRALGDRGYVVLRNLRHSPLLPPQELQLFRQDARVWRVGLDAPAYDLEGTATTLVLRTDLDTAPVLRAYAFDDGAIAWELDDARAANEDLVILDDADLVIERMGDGSLRAIDARDGSVRWAQPLDFAQGAGVTAIEHVGDVLRIFVGRAERIVDVSIASGEARSLAPETATTVCRTTEGVVWRDPSGTLFARALEPTAPARSIGRAPAGYLDCAFDRDRTWIAWMTEHPTELRSDTDERVVGSDPLASPEIPAEAPGALLVLQGDAFVWGRRFAYGGPWLRTYWPGELTPTPWEARAPTEGACAFDLRQDPVTPPPPRPPYGQDVYVDDGEWLLGPNATFDCETGEPIAP